MTLTELGKSAVMRTLSVAGSPISAAGRRPGILPPISRSKFRRMIPRPALEIGPFDVPFIAGPEVEYFDILDQDGLRQRATEEGRNPAGCPSIHYTGKLSDIPRRFPAVFSSHLIEHTPDLIGHLEDAAGILEPGGAYYLIIPDKRYCFDHYLPESTLDDVLAGRGRERPTSEAIHAHRMQTTHNIGPLHWTGIHGRPRNGDAKHDMEAARSGQYVDVHQWQFTPAGFREIVSELGYSAEVYDTAFGDLEFMAVLTARGSKSSHL